MKRYARPEIAELLPQQDPYLFLDWAETSPTGVEGGCRFDGSEFFFKGHFKTRPVLPAAIVSESAGQAAALWLAEHAPARLLPGETLLPEAMFVAMEEVRFRRPCLPGEDIHIRLRLKRFRTPLAAFSGTAHVGEELVAQFDAMTLAFAVPQAQNPA